MTRRDKIEGFILRETQQTYAELLGRVMRTGKTEMTDAELIQDLVKSVRALYASVLWLADELDQVEATALAR